MQSEHTSSDIKYRPDIDGLRAIAVVPVVMFHAFPKSFLKGGFIGVDVFFVISGYLISSILIRTLASDRFSITTFYSRRIRRIFPALIVLLLFCLTIGWLLLFSGEFKALGKQVSGSAAFIANFIFWDEVGYFEYRAEQKPLLHIWSLGVEEQFYIVWPLLLLLIWKSGIDLTRAIFILIAISFCLNIYLTYTDPNSAFYLPVSRFWELLMGASLAAMAISRSHSISISDNTKSYLGLALIILGLLIVQRKSGFPGFWVILPVFGAYLLISAGPCAWVNKNILSNKILVSIGLISYPLYLWHWPLLSFARIFSFPHDAPAYTRLLAVFCAFALSTLTYKFIELPIRFGSHRRVWAVMLLTALIGVGAFGSFIFLEDGIPSRFTLTPASSEVVFADNPHPLSNSNCRSKYPELKFTWSCLLSKPAEATLAIVGELLTPINIIKVLRIRCLEERY